VNDLAIRFGGIARLYGAEGLESLRQAHVCIVGLGGVGSWAVEALARSAIGALTLVDLDEVCVSNTNRQLHAMDGAVGRAKVEVMAERIRGISPGCRVESRGEFFTEATADSILDGGFDCVIEAIDDVPNKCRLIGACRDRRIPVVTCGAAGGRRDPTVVRVADLAFTAHDRLLQKVRVCLRRFHGFPRGEKPFGIECVYSPEAPVFPQRDGSVCATREAGVTDQDLALNCDSGFGAATFVTGTFGFMAAARVVQRIAVGSLEPPTSIRLSPEP